MASSRRVGTNESVLEYGTGKDYVEGELSVWEAFTDNDNVTGTVSPVLEVYKEGGGGGLWDDSIKLDDATNSANYFRIIRPASGNGHSGVPKDDGSIAGFRTTTVQRLMWISEDYTQVQDMGGKNSRSDATDNYVFVSGNGSYAAFVGCLVESCPNASSGGGYGFNVGAANFAINCLATACENTGFYGADGSYHYNCSSVNNSYGFIPTSGTMTVKNCLGDCTNQDYFGSFSATTCGSADATSPTVALRNQTYDYVDSVNKNFLYDSACDGTEDGTDLSADVSYAFDDDILGNLRNVGDWDIGFHEFGAEATTTVVTTLAPTTVVTTLVPTTAVTTAAPTTITTTAAPTTIATTIAPTTAITTLVPTTTVTTPAPTTEPPTPEPTTEPPTEPPSTSMAPTTALFTEQPLTSIAPTTTLTTAVPTSAPPTEAPITAVPTSAPPIEPRRRGIRNFGFSMRDDWR